MNFIRHCWNDFAVVIIVVVGFNWCFAFSLLLGELAFAVDSGLIFVLVVFPPPLHCHCNYWERGRGLLLLLGIPGPLHIWFSYRRLGMDVRFDWYSRDS